MPLEWECDITGCDQRFDDNEQFIQHKKDVHQCCICTICGIVLKNKYSLEVHTRRHTGKTNFTCRYCPSTFYTSQEYKLHLGLVHVATDTVNCDVCGLEFKKYILNTCVAVVNSKCLTNHCLIFQFHLLEATSQVTFGRTKLSVPFLRKGFQNKYASASTQGNDPHEITVQM